MGGFSHSTWSGGDWEAPFGTGVSIYVLLIFSLDSLNLYLLQQSHFPYGSMKFDPTSDQCDLYNDPKKNRFPPKKRSRTLT